MTYQPPPPPYGFTGVAPQAPSAPPVQQAQVRTGVDDNRLQELLARFEVSLDCLEDLTSLGRFDIILVLDDSGSMRGSRWQELLEVAGIVIEFCTALDDDGIDIHFLNRQIPDQIGGQGRPHQRMMLNVTHPSQLQNVFQAQPSGYTPLAETIQYALSKQTSKPKLVLVATDGVPTTRNGEYDLAGFTRVLKTRNADQSPMAILACSDNDDDVGYLNKLDKEVKNLDVLDDYQSEKREVLKAQGQNFKYTLGDHVVRYMLGPIFKKYDQLDEVKMGKKSVQYGVQRPVDKQSGCKCTIM